MAWLSFKKGSIPIGAVIVNETKTRVAGGRSQQYEKAGSPGEIVNHKLSHAELNALLKVGKEEHPDVRHYALYSTMEPCPLCFCAIAMSGIRRIEYAARDGYAGGVEINRLSGYIAAKKIEVSGPYGEMEAIQLTIQSVFEYRRGPSEKLLSKWSEDSKAAVDLAKTLFHEGTLLRFAEKDLEMSVVYDFLCGNLKRR
ncbi:MAG: nucleoside deaminase [Spirochaetes bacterium]|nr:nucleoside deaminase [Spirochaetota bacterium]